MRLMNSDELKNYRADDSFQLLTEDEAVAAICCLAVFAMLFAPWLQ